MSREMPELVPSPEIKDLRHAMDQVTKVREMAGMTINLARFDAETDGINKDFLGKFLGLLPVELGYSGNVAGQDTIADNFTIMDPLHIRPATSFGVFTIQGGFGANKQPKAGFVIGEAAGGTEKFPTTKLLIARQERTTDIAQKKWLKPTPYVMTVHVPAVAWAKVRDRGINLLATPHDKEQYTHNFVSSLGGYVVHRARSLGTPVVQAYSWNKNLAEVMTSRYERRRFRGEQKVKDELIGLEFDRRSLQTSDFETFGVMPHLEHIAAAFGVGSDFDKVKAAREAKMPAHPATTMLGLPADYRQTMEQYR